MRIIKTLVLVITMLLNSMTPLVHTYDVGIAADGRMFRIVEEKEVQKYEKIIDLCEEAANEGYINVYENVWYDEEGIEVFEKDYMVNKNYTVAYSEFLNYTMIAIGKGGEVIKGIITNESSGESYDAMEILGLTTVVNINDII